MLENMDRLVFINVFANKMAEYKTWSTDSTKYFFAINSKLF